jgi:hypothetical protein
MISRLVSVGALLSLLLVLVTTCFWIRSYSHIDQISFARSSQLWELRSQRGRFFIDNEPQREIDRLPRTMIARKLQRLRLADRETARQMKLADDEWHHQADRFAKGTADGPMARMGHLRAEYSAHFTELAIWQQLNISWTRQFAVSPSIAHSVPCSFLLLTAALPLFGWVALMLARIRRRRVNLREGRCLACNYSLVGNISGRCPECGAAIDRELSAVLNN